MKKVALLQQTNPTEAEALLQKWGAKHYRGMAGLREDVAKRIASKAVCRRCAVPTARPEGRWRRMGVFSQTDCFFFGGGALQGLPVQRIEAQKRSNP